MAAYLIRHGEVENPDHVVYADLPGFALSQRGRAQASAAGRYLAPRSVALIVTSPLERAVETAELLAGEIRAAVVTDDRLFEWRLSSRWAGVGWDDLPEVCPGELEAYLAHPYHLDFAPESLASVAARVAECVRQWVAQTAGNIAFVSHQDPIHAGWLHLTGIGPDGYQSAKPEHASVITLQPGSAGWSRTEYWSPEQ